MTTLQIQYLLAYLGYNVTPDGMDGPQTQGAAREFQADYGLTADGIAGRDTQKALKDSVAHDKFRPSGSTPDSDFFWDGIQYWTRQEFACRCGQYHTPYCDGFPVEPDETLVRLAERVRTYFGRPSHATSGIRCRQHNADQPNAAANSRHLYGKALDFWVEGVSGSELLAYVQAQPEVNYAYIVSGNVVHMDMK